jgi:hypothetical protein
VYVRGELATLPLEAQHRLVLRSTITKVNAVGTEWPIKVTQAS